MTVTVRELDLVMRPGRRFEQPIILYENGGPKDLSGYTARMDITEVSEEEPPPIRATYTTENSRLFIAAPAGKVSIVVPGVETGDYAWEEATYLLEIVDAAGEPVPIATGKVLLTGS